MTFNAYETSTEGGRPIRCYRFMFDDLSKVFGYTSCDTEQFIDDGTTQVWCVPVAIKDDGVKFSGDKVADTINITAASEIEPAQWFRRTPPSTAVRVTIHDRHVGDNEFTITYVGEIREASFDSPGQVKFAVSEIGASLDREGLRLCWQRTCPHTVYDPTNCKVNPVLWQTSIVVTDISASGITVEGLGGLPDHKFDGGFITFEHPVKGSMSLTVRSHVGNTLQIFEGTGDILPGVSAFVHPGCNHTPDACTAFGNYPNYGGVRSLPGKSPFDGNPVF